MILVVKVRRIFADDNPLLGGRFLIWAMSPQPRVDWGIVDAMGFPDDAPYDGWANKCIQSGLAADDGPMLLDNMYMSALL